MPFLAKDHPCPSVLPVGRNCSLPPHQQLQIQGLPPCVQEELRSCFGSSLQRKEPWILLSCILLCLVLVNNHSTGEGVISLLWQSQLHLYTRSHHPQGKKNVISRTRDPINGNSIFSTKSLWYSAKTIMVSVDHGGYNRTTARWTYLCDLERTQFSL